MYPPPPLHASFEGAAGVEEHRLWGGEHHRWLAEVSIGLCTRVAADKSGGGTAQSISGKTFVVKKKG
jgi:hypothetical protein